MDEGGGDRQRQHALRQHYGAGAKQQAEIAERARSGEQQVEAPERRPLGEARETQGRDHQDLPTRNGAGGKSRSARRAEQGGERGGGQADLEREKDDPPETLGIEDRPGIRDGRGSPSGRFGWKNEPARAGGEHVAWSAHFRRG